MRNGAAQALLPNEGQLLDEFVDAAPVAIDVLILEVLFEVPLGAARIQTAALFRIDLDRNVRFAAAQASAWLAHDRPEENAKAPFIRLEAQKKKRNSC